MRDVFPPVRFQPNCEVRFKQLFVTSVPARHPHGGFMFYCTCSTCMEPGDCSEQSSGSMLQRERERGGKMKAEINEVRGIFLIPVASVEDTYSSFVVYSC